VSAFGSQVTVLALPLTAVLYLHATAVQMGLLNGASELPDLCLQPGVPRVPADDRGLRGAAGRPVAGSLGKEVSPCSASIIHRVSPCGLRVSSSTGRPVPCTGPGSGSSSASKFDDGQKVEFTQEITDFCLPPAGHITARLYALTQEPIPLALHVGTTIPVCYDPADRTRMSIDEPVLHEAAIRQHMEAVQARHARADAILDASEPVPGKHPGQAH
jgi:hypothetical protein